MGELDDISADIPRLFVEKDPTGGEEDGSTIKFVENNHPDETAEKAENTNNIDAQQADSEDDADLAVIDMGPPVKVGASDFKKIAELFKSVAKPTKAALQTLTKETQLDRKDANWCFIKLRHKFETVKGKPANPEAVDLFVKKRLDSRKLRSSKITL